MTGLPDSLVNRVKSRVNELYRPSPNTNIDLNRVAFGDCYGHTIRWYRFWEIESRKIIGAAACAEENGNSYLFCRLGSETIIEASLSRENSHQISLHFSGEPLGILDCES